MSRTAFLLAATLLLAACSSEPDVDARNASVEEVAEQVRSANNDQLFVRPGKWQSTVTIEDISLPGMPPEMVEQMKATMAQHQQQNFESCLTEEEARRPKEDFFAGKNNSCRYEHFTMGDGKIDARMRCEQDGASQVMEMDGTYSLDEYTMRMSTSTQGGEGATASMTMKMRVDSKRIGECDPKAT